jgi:hypothetical protein
MKTHRLSKSAFKVGRSCPTKLYYYRSKYESTNNENPYLKFLADGGYMVGALAHVIYKDGTLIESGKDQEAAAAKTEEALKQENVTLFEAALRAGNKLVRVDILEKRGKSIKLIEVKSKSFDSDEEQRHKSEGKRTTFVNGKGNVDSDWRPYLEDICYQMYVATLAHPEFEFVPYLLLPDKALTTSVDGLGSMFKIDRLVDASGKEQDLQVTFLGDEAAKDKLRGSHFMVLKNVEDEVSLVWDEVREAAEELDKSLTPALKKIAVAPGRHCSDCEYRVKGAEPNGFRECWGESADPVPHIFDLYYGTMIQGGSLYDSLIAQKKTSLFDVSTALLAGKRGDRQLIQINNSKAGTEWFSDELPATMRGVAYPLYFIDFETSRMAVPYHGGMTPYEQIAFQWSCHTVEAPGAAPKHTEWINVDHVFPNFDFAKSLREQIGDKGSVLTWAHHERSVLADIAAQMKKYRQDDADLADWLAHTVHEDGGRILDLNKVTLKNYFHPEMKGKTSLKAVLPAVWNNDPGLHEIPWLAKYVEYDGDGGKVLDPYKTLRALEIAGQAEAIREGTGAMRAYQHMVYGTGQDAPAETKEKWRRLLLQYCELDTIAMLVVWTYWERRLGVAR